MSFDYLLSLDQSLLLALNGSDSLYLDGLMLTYTSGFTWIPLYVGLLYLVIKNCSPKETAKMLNISEENVQVRFTQARQLLRQHAEA